MKSGYFFGEKRMFQSPNPHRDAEAHEDMTEAQDGAHEFVCGRIRQALTVDIMHVKNIEHVAVPFASYPEGVWHNNAREVSADYISESLADDSEDFSEILSAILQKSTCPHVAKLREAMADFWIKSYAHKLSPNDF